MVLGIGLGAFVDGFAQGYGLRQQSDERERQRQRQDVEDTRAAERHEWAEEDRAFQVGERQRAASQRQAIEDLNADVREDFEEGVAAGEYKATEYDKFWKEYGLPRMQNELLSQGDIDGAKKLMEWGESEAALKGGRLFSQAMFLANTGQAGDALDKVIEAGKVRGYIGDDFDIDEKEEIRNEDGTVIGYRVTIRDGEGNETIQDIAAEDVPNVIATFANPQAAWETQQATAAARTKRDQELEDYEARKEIDSRYNGKDNAAREAAIKSLRERHKADPLNEEAVAFDAMPREEREKMIAEEISFQKGTASAPAERMIVDMNSGQGVPMPTPTALEQAPGLGAVPKPAAATPAPAPSPAAPKPAQLNAVINGKADPGLPNPQTQTQIVNQAAQDLVDGKDPQQIAQTLQQVGVDKTAWPAELVRVLGQ